MMFGLLNLWVDLTESPWCPMTGHPDKENRLSGTRPRPALPCRPHGVEQGTLGHQEGGGFSKHEMEGSGLAKADLSPGSWPTSPKKPHRHRLASAGWAAGPLSIPAEPRRLAWLCPLHRWQVPGLETSSDVPKVMSRPLQVPCLLLSHQAAQMTFLVASLPPGTS